MATGIVKDLSLKDVSQRLAEFLMEQDISDDSLFLKHSNQEIADIIGTVREVVSRAFAKLQRKNWIIKDGRSVKITNREALEDHITGYES
jgi:CRP-like cAMP-binding protein